MDKSEQINTRAQQVLKMLVEGYIRDGQPVGSRTLADRSELGLSPATIRNVLADLEERGYLTSPHTSAGRIPTAQGYRLFVDSLLTIDPLDTETINRYRAGLVPHEQTDTLLTRASGLVSHVTQLVGLVTLPRRNQITLRHVEFLPLSGRRVLVILVVNEQEVQNRIIHTEKAYSGEALQQIANYLNAHYAGQDLSTARHALVGAMQADQDQITELLQMAMALAQQAFVEPAKEEDYVLSGQDHLLAQAPPDNSIVELQQLFAAFAQKREILALLDDCLRAQGVRLFIGEESGHEALTHYSLVSAPYTQNGQVVGVLSVIGPTRMPYAQVIATVDVTARLLSAALDT